MIDPRAFPVRYSHLKHIGRSPAHYLASLTEESKDTRAMRVGFGVHAIVLGGHFAVFDGERRGNAWKAFEAEQSALGLRILTGSEANDANAIAAAVQAHPSAMAALDGEHELEVKWAFLGRDFVSHVDAFMPGIVTELKVTNDASPDRFPRTGQRMGYHAQLAMYGEAKGVDRARIVAVEDKRPYAVQVFELSDRALEQGRKMMRIWTERLLACEASNHWPAYCEVAVPFDVPDDIELDFTGLEAA